MANKSIPLNSGIRKVLLLPFLILIMVGAVVAAKWSFASFVGPYADNKETAEFALGLNPHDPANHLSLAKINEKSFLPDDFDKALTEYETAVALRPNDFRLWQALATARDRNGDSAGAEKALRKALQLAPSYSQLHWALGNFLLRQGNNEEAFFEIRKAVEGDPGLAPSAVLTAWQMLNEDVSAVSGKIGDSDSIKAELVVFLARKGNFEEALKMWNSLPQDGLASKYDSHGKDLVSKLLAVKRFRDAALVRKQISENGANTLAINSISNPGFEEDIKPQNPGPFEWAISDGNQPQIGFDNQQKKDGQRSLVIVCNSLNGKEFRTIQQTFPVESGRSFRIESFYRTDLENPVTAKWEILDATDGKILGTTSDFAQKADWTQIGVDVSVPSETQAITIKLTRAACKQSICPLVGKIWVDGISIE